MSYNNNENSNGGFNVRFPAKQPAKKSIFERQRAEAEAKRKREAAETAAVYEDFVKSFDDGGSAPAMSEPKQQQHSQQPFSASLHQPKGGSTAGATGGRRHFSIPASAHGGIRHSGPGNNRPRDGRPDRLSDVRTRLAFGDDDDGDDDDTVDRENGDRTRGRDNDEEGQVVEDDGPRNLTSGAIDRAEEKAASKPTMRLANMPPGTSPAAIKALVVGSSRLTVNNVRILPSSGTASTDRKSVAAIVTLAAETAASDIDAAVSAMQNRYLGFGYYLTLHRHLSSAVVAASSTSMATGSSASAQPFGARPVSPASKTDNAPSTGFAPPGFSQGGGRSFQGGRGMGIPPPATYNSPGTAGGIAHREGILHVPVRAPRDIKKLRMIHKVIEQVLDQGPAFEALLMSRPEVQLQEKWAWLWDARCEAGVWYRYRLWETVTGLGAQHEKSKGHAKGGKYVPLFEGGHAWKTPDNPLPYEFDTSLTELVSDSDYVSSDDSDAEGAENTTAAAAVTDDDQETFLNPLEKARLTHLLARLPTTLSKLRKGDIARVTAFAITHASRGANEIVDLIVANVERPLAYTAANPDYRGKQVDEHAHADGGGDALAEADTTTNTDTSSAQLIAVYVVSDILSSSATSGIRHAWRFRQLFDAALHRRNVFALLGRLANKFGWGRMRAEKWKRSIGLVLGHWEGWSVFSAETQAFLVSSFENPPSVGKSGDNDGDEFPPAAADTTTESTKKSRWKTVETTATAPTADGPAASGFRIVDDASASSAADGGQMVVDSEHDTSVKEGATTSVTAYNTDNNDDDEWAYRSDYTDDEALDLACMDDEDIDGEPMGDIEETHLHGIPLTMEEIRALVDDLDDEMSEEGEIATDDEGDEDKDDDYEAYGISDRSSGSGSENAYSNDNDNDGGLPGNSRDIAMHDAPHAQGTAALPAAAAAATFIGERNLPRTRPERQERQEHLEHQEQPEQPEQPEKLEPPADTVHPTEITSASSALPRPSARRTSSVQTPQPTSTVRMQVGSSSTAASTFPPRKRMRAADMFDDSGDEGQS
ncbi:U2-associated protein SR140 [Sporothrix schenckii 1099-18]|uniref:U2-associated protein SR140 n=1 Tax=Sporothrix schenckii 1099-18 TaxID=1397361 RepID=A0A0F2M2F7_SPOSC|nr:U2-associated protein SR140 [Sporothrix schenckii 1099-18]KJR83284.1 U2-associated protein SR140 [Sporothrix schenckii 1099-18]